MAGTTRNPRPLRFWPVLVSGLLALALLGPLAARAAWDMTADPWVACANQGTAFPAADAIAACSAIIAAGKDTPNDLAIAHFNRGNEYSRSDELDLAHADYTAAVALAPQLSGAYNNRGLIEERRGRIDAAIADYTQAIAHDSGNFKALFNRGYLLQGRSDLDGAIADYSAALALRPDYVKALNFRGTAYRNKNQLDRAIADFEAALALVSDYGAARANLEEAKAARELAMRPQIPSGQSPTAEGRRVALIIGNGDYRFTTRLPNPPRDAAKIAAALGRFGFEVLGYPKVDFTLAEFEAALDAFRVRAEGAAVALVYYAGHGMEVLDEDAGGTENWLFPVDARVNSARDVRRAAVPLPELFAAVARANGLRLVVLDACRNNTFLGQGRGARGLARVERQGMLIVFSTRAGKIADDGAGDNSPFATAFLKALDSHASRDVRILFGQVAKDVLSLTGNEQEPERIDLLIGGEEFTLAAPGR